MEKKEYIAPSQMTVQIHTGSVILSASSLDIDSSKSGGDCLVNEYKEGSWDSSSEDGKNIWEEW